MGCLVIWNYFFILTWFAAIVILNVYWMRKVGICDPWLDVEEVRSIKAAKSTRIESIFYEKDIEVTFCPCCADRRSSTKFFAVNFSNEVL